MKFNSSGIAIYKRGIAFCKRYELDDIVALIGSVMLASIIFGLKYQSFKWAGVTAIIAMLVNLYFFRPVYGYINTQKGVAMTRWFTRRPLATLSMEIEGETLKLIAKDRNEIFFSVPNVSLSQFQEIRKKCASHFPLDGI